MRKIKLNPIENEILWILDEAGSEVTTTVYATLASARIEITAAIEHLEKLGFIYSDLDVNGNREICLSPLGRESMKR